MRRRIGAFFPKKRQNAANPLDRMRVLRYYQKS
jgi:hypothetical protein